MSATQNTITEPCRHTFDTIAGHDVLKTYLRSAMRNGVLPHALLFQGPRGLGKTSMAYALARALNCSFDAPAGCPCDVCRKIAEGIFTDLLMVEPRGAAGQLTIGGWKSGKDDPDNLQYYRFIDSRPLDGSKKVLILRQADRMNPALSNYLLKLIEEPPSYLLVILVTHRPNDLLVTVRSRCAPLRFSPLTADEIGDLARAAARDGDSLSPDALVALSEGKPGQLFELAAGTSSTMRNDIARLMTLFQEFGFVSLFKVASDLLRSGPGQARGGVGAIENFEAILNELQTWLRDAMIGKTVPPEQARKMMVNQDCAQKLMDYAAKASFEGLCAAMDFVRQAHVYAPRQTEKTYVLEMLLLKIGRAMK